MTGDVDTMSGEAVEVSTEDTGAVTTGDFIVETISE